MCACDAEIIPCYDADSFDFVALIKGSEGVVTNSFHGMMATVQFEKPGSFFLRTLSKSNSCSSRFTDFLNQHEINGVTYDTDLFDRGENCTDTMKLIRLGSIKRNFKQIDRILLLVWRRCF